MTFRSRVIDHMRLAIKNNMNPVQGSYFYFENSIMWTVRMEMMVPGLRLAFLRSSHHECHQRDMWLTKKAEFATTGSEIRSQFCGIAHVTKNKEVNAEIGVQLNKGDVPHFLHRVEKILHPPKVKSSCSPGSMLIQRLPDAKIHIIIHLHGSYCHVYNTVRLFCVEIIPKIPTSHSPMNKLDIFWRRKSLLSEYFLKYCLNFMAKNCNSWNTQAWGKSEVEENVIF